MAERTPPDDTARACTCEKPISVYDGPSDPAEDCPTHGNPAVTTPPDDTTEGEER